MNTNVQAMIFDLDGTLVDSGKDIVNATNQTIQHFGGKPLPLETILGFVGKGVRDLIHQAITSVTNATEAEVLQYFAIEYQKNSLIHSCLMPGAKELLDSLRDDAVPMAILSNKPQIFLDHVVKGLGIKSYFTHVIGAESAFPSKPNPQGALAIISDWAMDPSRVLMIGDSVVDLQTAQNSGMKCALSLTGFSPRVEIESYRENADILYEDLSELIGCWS